MADHIVWYVLGACALVCHACANRQIAPAALARQAPLARGAFAHGAPLRGPRALLRVRRGPHLSGRRGAAGASPPRAARASCASPATLASAVPEECRADRRRSSMRSPICSSPAATACPFSSAASCAEHFKAGAFVESSAGVTLTDLDGNRFYDLTGSYGVNVFGYDFYKECIARGSERVRDLGPVLGAYHPVIAYNVRRLLEISGLDEVSFHMSGTEAVMQAVRLARYHTRRSHLVRFCGAYHGWWGDVQPGVGNPARRARDLHARGHGRARLSRCCAAAATSPACWSIRCRRCIPNANAPGDSALLDSGRSAHFDRAGLRAHGSRSCARCAASAASC